MLICNDQRNGEGCGFENPDGSTHCRRCGLSLRFAVQLHDPGSRISERYQIVRVIGYGTFGAVYETIDEQEAGRRVALKQTFHGDTMRGFQREFAALAGLHHPNLPAYYDFFTDDGSGYLVMEFVPGQSLEEIAARSRGTLPEQVVLPYAEQICDLLSYLHGQHPPLLHRDIKPANIRVTPEGVAKLVDFGLLKQGVQRTRQTIHGLGTLEYMPLEQFDWSGGTDQRSDIYSLGATLYHLLTGQWPISAPKRMTKARDPLRPPHKLNRQISPHVSDAVMRAMSRFPQDRYPSAEAFKRDLLGKVQRYIRGARIGAILKGHVGFVYAVAWRPDGQILASASGDQRVQLWHPADGARLAALEGHTDQVRCLAWSPDGQTLASGGNDRTLRLWCPGDGQLLRAFSGHTDTITSLAWHLDGDMLASASFDGSIRLWSISDGALLSEIRTERRMKVHSLDWRPDGQILAAAYSDGTVRLWHVAESLSLHVLPGHNGAVYSVAWSPDGQTLASAGSDATVRLWRLAKGHLVNELQKYKNWAAKLAWSPIGQVAGFPDQPSEDPVWLWRISDGSLCTLLTGHHNHIYSVVWSPDGQALASAGADTSVRIWRDDGTPICLLTGHTDWVYGLAWDPTGQTLASASLDGHVQLWDLE